MSDGAPQDVTTMLVRAAASGDDPARSRLVERFTPLLLAQARYRLVGAAARYCEPEDLVQEAWAITLPRLGSLRFDQQRMTPVLLKFLATTMLRLATQVLRKHVLRRGTTALPASDVSAAIAAVPDEVSGIVTRLCRQEHGCALGAAIAALPPELREVLVLRGIEQHDNGECARLLGVDDSTVTRRYQKALATLREALQGDLVAELE